MHGIFTHNLLPTNRRSVWADLWSLRRSSMFFETMNVYLYVAVSIEKVLSDWTLKSSVFVWGTGEKKDFCVPLGFNDVCVCWGEVTGCLSTHSSCGGRSYGFNRRPHAVWAEPRAGRINGVARLTSQLLLVPFMSFHLFHILRPPFPTIRPSFLVSSRIFPSF